MAYKYIVGTKKSTLAQEESPNKYEIYHKGLNAAVNSQASAGDTRSTLPGGLGFKEEETTTTTSTTTTTTTAEPTTTTTSTTTTTTTV